MNVIDYSKWNNLTDSSDDEDDCTSHIGCHLPHEIEQKPANKNKPTLRNKQAKFVKMHPEDSGKGLSDIFFTHPDAFIPSANGKDGIYYWGLRNDCETWIKQQRKMETQMMYGSMFKEYPDTPEQQFVKRLIKNKEKELEKRKLGEVVMQNLKRDYILKIKMVDIKPEVWRRFKVSGLIINSIPYYILLFISIYHILLIISPS